MRLLRGVAQHEVPCPVSMFQRGMNIGYALKTLIKVKRMPSSIVGMVIMLFFMLCKRKPPAKRGLGVASVRATMGAAHGFSGCCSRRPSLGIRRCDADLGGLRTSSVRVPLHTLLE